MTVPAGVLAACAFKVTSPTRPLLRVRSLQAADDFFSVGARGFPVLPFGTAGRALSPVALSAFAAFSRTTQFIYFLLS